MVYRNRNSEIDNDNCVIIIIVIASCEMFLYFITCLFAKTAVGKIADSKRAYYHPQLIINKCTNMCTNKL